MCARSERSPIALDLFDPRAVREAVLESAPDAIVNQVTALADVRFTKDLERSFEQTNVGWRMPDDVDAAEPSRPTQETFDESPRNSDVRVSLLSRPHPRTA